MEVSSPVSPCGESLESVQIQLSLKTGHFRLTKVSEDVVRANMIRVGVRSEEVAFSQNLPRHNNVYELLWFVNHEAASVDLPAHDVFFSFFQNPLKHVV